MKGNNRKINDMRDVQNELGRSATKKGFNLEMLEKMPVPLKEEETDRYFQTPVQKRASSKMTPVKSTGASAKAKSAKPTPLRSMTTPLSGQSANGTQSSTGKRKMMGSRMKDENDGVDYPDTPSKRSRSGRKTVPGYRASNLQSSQNAFNGNGIGFSDFTESHSMSNIHNGGMSDAQSPFNARVTELLSPGLPEEALGFGDGLFGPY